MANPAFRVKSTPSFRDLQGRWAKADDAIVDRSRELMKGEGRVMVAIARAHLREKTKPYTNEKFEKTIKFNTRATVKGVKLNLTAPAKARPHKIAPRFANALAFNWPKVGMFTIVPKRGGFRTHVSNGRLFVGKGYVDHPGGSLVPLMSPIIERTGDEWMKTRGKTILNKISSRYVAIMAGKD